METEEARRQRTHGDRDHIETGDARRQDTDIEDRRDTHRGERDGDRRHTENTGYDKISSFLTQKQKKHDAQKKAVRIATGPSDNH